MSEKELARLKKLVRAETAGKRDGAYSFLSSLNEDIATGDWTRFVTLPEQLLVVTPSQVRAVAKKYLNNTTSTVGWFVPKT